MGIPRVIFANDGMAVPVSNAGGPFVVLTATGLPDTIETFGDPEEVEVEVVCGREGVPESEGVGVGALDV